MSAIEEFKKMLKEAQESSRKLLEETPVTIVQEENIVQKTARLIRTKNDDTPSTPENIEQQRWNDPLKNTGFVTRKEMNDSYGLFLQRIQQQMSTIGGGGEVNFRGLDDVLTSTTGTNKYLTYDQSTRKFVFDTVETGEGLYLNGNNEVSLSVASSSALGGIKIGSTFTLDESNRLQLNAATDEIIGGIKLGPGVTTNIEGQIIIDSEGLDFSFGDFAAITGTYSSNTSYALLSSIVEDEDIVLASNGAGGIKVVGDFEVFRTNGSVTGSLEEEPSFFRIKDDGQVRILVPVEDLLEGGIEIIGSATGTYIAPGIEGTMLHMTGNPNVPCRVYQDTLGNYTSYVARRYNGTVLAPTQVLANEDVFRINATAATNAGMGSVSLAQIRFTALENQTTTAQGSKITLTVTPIGSAATDRVDVMTVTVADGVSATKFTGPLIGNVTGNVSGSAGSVVNALTAGTYLTSSGTYNGSTARTFAVDATTAATASKVVARDANAIVAGSNFQGTVRNAGVVTGTTVTLDFNSDHMVHCTFIGDFTVAFSNYTAGRTITLIATNTSAGDSDVVTAGISSVRMQGDSTLTVPQQTTAIVTYYCVGTTVNDVYASAVYA